MSKPLSLITATYDIAVRKVFLSWVCAFSLTYRAACCPVRNSSVPLVAGLLADREGGSSRLFGGAENEEPQQKSSAVRSDDRFRETIFMLALLIPRADSRTNELFFFSATGRRGKEGKRWKERTEVQQAGTVSRLERESRGRERAYILENETTR